MSKFLVITEGEKPATAEPVLATASPRLIRAALSAVLHSLGGDADASRDKETEE